MSKKPLRADANAAERAYNYFLNKTVSFGFFPGERVNEVELATALGMSRAPIREALTAVSIMQTHMVNNSKDLKG